jgi:hypothetical protein
MAIAERFRRLSRIGLNEASVGVRQVDCKEVDLALNATDHTKRLAKVDLGMTRLMGEWNEHLALSLPRRKDIILHDRHAAGKAVLIT